MKSFIIQEKHGSLGLCYLVSNPPVVGSIVGNCSAAGGGVDGGGVGGGEAGGGVAGGGVAGGVAGSCKNLLGSR
jgi:hypothetical protein